MTWHLVPAASLVASPWRNRLGTSREVVTLAEAGTMAWQIGIADLERDAAFSDYPGVDRIFTPIAGDPPPALAFHGGAFEPCPLLVPKPFPGDVPTLSRIPAPGRAFNVLVRRGRYAAEVAVLRQSEGPVPLPQADTVVLHCLSGRIGAAGPGDTLIGRGGPIAASSPCVLIRVAINPVPSTSPAAPPRS